MPERDIQLYLEDILDSCTAVTEYVAGKTFEEFCNERARLDGQFGRKITFGLPDCRISRRK